MTIDYQSLTVEQLQSMTDEEFARLDPSQIPQGEGSSVLTSDMLTTSGSNEANDQQLQDQPVTQPETAPEQDQALDQNQPTPVVEQEQVIEETQTGAEQSEATREGISVNHEAPSSQQPTPTQQPQTQSTPEADFYQQVTAKFNASGKEFQVTDAKDVVALMQKGIDYNVKMATLKPSLKMVKALEANGITQEDLGVLIDLHQRKPEAIARIVKDADIDLYSVDEEKVNSYTPTHAAISDADYAFNEVADSLSHRPKFQEVINFIGSSAVQDQEHVYQNPELLAMLTSQAESGLFDQIMTRVMQERAVGRLQGMTNLQAYDAIGRTMFGGEPTPQQQPVTQPVVNQVAQPAPVPQVQTQRAPNPARNAAAAPSTQKAGHKQSSLTPHDIWSMSDEEFAKIDPKFLT